MIVKPEHSPHWNLKKSATHCITLLLEPIPSTYFLIISTPFLPTRCVWSSVCFGKFHSTSPWDVRAIANVWSHVSAWQAWLLFGGFISFILFHPRPCLSPLADIPDLQHVHCEWQWAGLSSRGNSMALLEVQFPACHPTIWVTAQLTDTTTLKEAITSFGGMSFLKKNDPCFHLSP